VRILQLCYEYPPIGGGGGQVVAALSQELVKQGNQVDVVTMGFDDLASSEVREGVNISRVPAIRSKKSICHPHEMASYLASAFPRVLRMVKQNRYDINHTHFIFPDGILSASIKRFTGLPYIITAHGSDVPGYNPNRFKNLHKIMKPLWHRAVRDANSIVSPSQRLANLIRGVMPDIAITLIPNGINPEYAQTEIKGNTNILIVSRMFERKGIQYFLKSLDGFTHPIGVDIVGDGPYLPTLKVIANKINSRAAIKFHGWLDNHSPEFKNLISNASLFVMPSESENFPIVLLEAMAAGLAIITTRGTGCEEVVGNAAMLVKPRDPQAIRDAIQALIGNPTLRRQLGKTARLRVEEEFTWGAIAHRYEAVYQLGGARIGTD
jgi:glycosyltransferase involved in cell wall biosynthesis